MAPKTRYPGLSNITDPQARAVLKLAFDKIALLEQQSVAIGSVSQPLTKPLNANAQRLTTLADPAHDLDAVNFQTLKRYVESAIASAALPPSTKNPIPAGSGTGPPSPPPPPPMPPPTPGPGTFGVFMTPQMGNGTVQCGGLTFHLANGTLWPWRGATDFLLYKRYLDGEDIAPILASRVAMGANLVRVFGMAFNIAVFDPSTYPLYFTALPTFLALLNASGLFCEFVVFADAQLLANYSGSSAQRTHYNQVLSAISGASNVFVELVNEYALNGVDPTLFNRPAGILASAGSGGGDQDPALPPWDYATYHSARTGGAAGQWPRKAKSIQDLRDDNVYGPNHGLRRPVVNDEPMGAGDADSSSRSTHPDDFYWYGATSQMMGAGATFHSDQGISSVVYSGIQQTCGNSFFQGLTAVDPAAQLWSYTDGPNPASPIQHDDTWALRTYGKQTGNQAICVVIRPTGLWPGPIPQNGWTVDHTVGPVYNGFGTLVYLTR